MSDPSQLEQPQPVAAVIVLAAGAGTRMKSTRSKLLHEIGGRSMLSYAVSAAEALQPEHLVVVVGHQRQQVIEHLAEIAPEAVTAVQDEQRGTGHAVSCGLGAPGLESLTGDVVVTYGDVPLLSGETLQELVLAHRAAGAGASVLTGQLADAGNYGRIVRDATGGFERIVEARDANAEELAITEINSGIYVFDARVLRDGLSRLNPSNAQGELYVTDVLGIARGDGQRIGTLTIDDLWQTEGVNDRVQLAAMNAELNRRICERWMREGVTIIDPASTWIQPDVDLARDVTLLPGTSLEGATLVGEGATIGPDTTLRDVEVGPGASVVRCHGELAVIGEQASVGPFAYLRPGTRIGVGGKVGTFVETKNTTVGDGAKVPHLCYAGDAVIDAGANIGAGTIFANYDGEQKWHTHVGRQAFIGSNSVLVAPVDIGDGAFVAAGSAVTENVPPGDLAVARGRQHDSADWVRRRKPDSKFAAAVETAAAYRVNEKVADQQKGQDR